MAEVKRQVPLEFEKPLSVLAQQIDNLEAQLQEQPDLEPELRHLKEQYTSLRKSLYSNLRPIDRLAIARHPERPYTRDYFERWDSQWIELHGDRHGTDDSAMVGGLLDLGNDLKVIAVGTQKGRNIKEKQSCNFGMPQPEGYAKALRLFKHAEKFGLPIVTLIDTPGAFPGLAAEEHNQAQAIAINLLELLQATNKVVMIMKAKILFIKEVVYRVFIKISIR